MNPKSATTKELEKTARDMREFIRRAQRKLLEFEVRMSKQEIASGQAEEFATPDDLLVKIDA